MAAPDAAFIELLTQYQGILHKICRAYCPREEDRRDLFQEMALQLWRAWPGFRGEAKTSTWIYRVALNTAVSGLRKTRPLQVELTEAAFRMPEPEGENTDRVEQLYRAMYVLSDVEKAVLFLYFEDKSADEIAVLTGLTPNNVRVRLHRIREKLKTVLL